MCCFLVLIGLGAGGQNIKEERSTEYLSYDFSNLILNEKNEYIEIELNEASSYTFETHKPMVPVVHKEYIYPFGTNIEDIEVNYLGENEQYIQKPIRSAPESHVKSLDVSSNFDMTNYVIDYREISVYPIEDYNYKTCAGLNGKEHVIYLNIYIYPVKYYPQENKIIYYNEAEIKININKPKESVNFPYEYDFLIISPPEFENALNALVEHKNQNDIRTILVTLDEIPDTGVDEPESIKYYIRDSIENWGITDVLLVGSGTPENEKFPVRYAYLPDRPHEEDFPTVLYYADVYNSTLGFPNWDYDGDGKYAEYRTDTPNMDLLPDVNLGLLPCNNVIEVNTIVDKIIQYKAHNKMTKKILQIGGDTFIGEVEAICEGEYANTKVLEELPGYASTKLWASEEMITKPNIANGFKSYVDFVDFSGHGGPTAWGTHPPGNDDVWVPKKTTISPERYFLYVDFDIYNINNWRKLPVVVYNACSNAKFTNSEQCLAWKTLSKINGGGIASFAASGLGFGMSGSDETSRRWGWVEVNLFKNMFNIKNLGETWSNVVTGYVNSFSSVDWERIDQKTVVALTMFGDPTLNIEDGDDPKNLDEDMSILQKIIEYITNVFRWFRNIISDYIK